MHQCHLRRCILTQKNQCRYVTQNPNIILFDRAIKLHTRHCLQDKIRKPLGWWPQSPYIPRGSAREPPAQELPKPPQGSIGIGIEMEFLLESRVPPPPNKNTFPRFARRCAMLYNSTVPTTFPRMHSLVQAQWEGVPHTQWVLHHDPSCATWTEPCK